MYQITYEINLVITGSLPEENWLLAKIAGTLDQMNMELGILNNRIAAGEKIRNIIGPTLLV